MIISLTPNLMVRDVRSSIEYYQDVLVFELNAWVENETNPDIYDFAMISFDGLVLMLQDAASLQAEHPDMKGICIGQSLTLFFKVLDVTELYKTLKRKTTIYKEPYNTFYGTREFCVRDPNGYILTFAQDVEPENEG